MIPHVLTKKMDNNIRLLSLWSEIWAFLCVDNWKNAKETAKNVKLSASAKLCKAEVFIYCYIMKTFVFEISCLYSCTDIFYCLNAC